MQQQTPEAFDLAGMAADLNTLLRLKTTVIGMKMFASVEEMTAIPKIRRPTAVHTTDQIVSMASHPRTKNFSRANPMSGSGTARPRTRASARKRWMSWRSENTRRWR